jgi:NAD(P)H-dependent flavin oxidoreductase YrpB (nitropropane dioxygenase family)
MLGFCTHTPCHFAPKPLPHLQAPSVRQSVLRIAPLMEAAKTIGALKEAGCIILCSATNVAEAKSLAAAGVHAIIRAGL